MVNNATNNQELTELLARVRAAQEIFSTYSQEQVDKIFLAAATAANKARIIWLSWRWKKPEWVL